jgi:hypothetical protein
LWIMMVILGAGDRATPVTFRYSVLSLSGNHKRFSIPSKK